MEYIKPVSGTVGQILCCQCGVPIEPNPTNTCVTCLRREVDITQGIPRQSVINWCKGCERYLQPPATWIKADLESRDLLTLLIKKLKGTLTQVRLIDASFIWTEPHSRRIKIKLVVQKEIQEGAILEQTVPIEFVVQGAQCTDCQRVEAKDYWKSVVQVRQQVKHKRTFLYVEQVILKHGMFENTLRIGETQHGLDFFYGRPQDSRKLLEFLQHISPVKYKTSQKLIGHDVNNATYNYKQTYHVELPTVCKDDLICLSKKQAGKLGNMGQVLLCLRVTSTIQLIDPLTLQLREVMGSHYWNEPFYSILDSKRLVTFTVMEKEELGRGDRNQKAGEGKISFKHGLADLWVIRSSEIGQHEDYIHCRSHLGKHLEVGDECLGYDLKTSNINSDNLDNLDGNYPDAVLVRKVFAKREKRVERRKWMLKRIIQTKTDNDADLLAFQEELEEDEEARKNVNIYRDPNKNLDSDCEEDIPRIDLAEMMEMVDLNKNDEEMPDLEG